MIRPNCVEVQQAEKPQASQTSSLTPKMLLCIRSPTARDGNIRQPSRAVVLAKGSKAAINELRTLAILSVQRPTTKVLEVTARFDSQSAPKVHHDEHDIVGWVTS